MSDSNVRGGVTGVAAGLLGMHWLMRVPVALYRARLGFLLGSRFLLLEHRGRVSGQTRRVVLEVIGHPADNAYLVVSGFGTRAQWFRNVRATPRVRITTGGHGPRPAQADILDRELAAAALAAYAEANPRAWEAFKPVLQTTLGGPAEDVPVVRLDVLRR